MSAAEDYILLGLRLGRHVDGLVDAYYGPPELKEQVDAEPVRESTDLVGDADSLLGQLEAGWLRDQAHGLRTYAGVLAGEEPSYSDEVEDCYGLRPQRVGTEQYEAVHERLEELLPGDGPLGDRYEEWREARTLPAERVVPAMNEVMALLREETARVVELPQGEGLVLEEVRDEPWWAFNYYLGDLRSRVVVNLDQPDTADDIVELVMHEVYPGHHTEHAVKEQRFIRDRGEIEESIQMVPTPAALLQEGLAETGPTVVLRPDVLARLSELLDADLEHQREMREAWLPLRRLGLDAALMIHEDGASHDEVESYLTRWSLLPRRACAAHDPLRHRPDVARLRDQLLGRRRALPLVGRRRPGSVRQARKRTHAGVGFAPAGIVGRVTEAALYIGGEQVEGSESRQLVEPATGDPLATVQLAGEKPRSTARSRPRAARSTATGARRAAPSARDCCTRSPTRSSRTATSWSSSSPEMSARPARR